MSILDAYAQAASFLFQPLPMLALLLGAMVGGAVTNTADSVPAIFLAGPLNGATLRPRRNASRPSRTLERRARKC